MTGTVRTVSGPIPTDGLGLTLMHEHVLVDASAWWHKPETTDTRKQAIAHVPLSIEFLGALRNDPFLSLDNTQLDDESLAVEELQRFADVGGRTVVDPTCNGIGRDPSALKRVSRATGLNLVMGSGYYLEGAHPEHVGRMTIDDIANEIEGDVIKGVANTGVRAGIIGEIGISKNFTAEEEKVLRGSARAQARTRVPLMVHLPGWERLGGPVLDAIAEEGGDVGATVLCHMNPSLEDPTYQMELASRGAWVEYDMIGMDFYYADQTAQSPCDEENARAITRLVRDGYCDHLLLSSDVFLKMMLVRYGGLGYGHVIENFAPRLRRHGLDDSYIKQLLIHNPRRVFEQALRGGAR
jgi:phosphotriesterase-related protein